MDLHIARALEFLVDDLVHAAARVHQGGRDDGEAPAVFGVSGGAKKILRLVQAPDVQAARKRPASRRHGEVVRTREPRDGIEQDHNVLPRLDEPLRLIQRRLGDANVVFRHLVKRRVEHLRLGRAHDVGHFLGALVDEQDIDRHLGVVFGNRVCDLLEQHRLSRLGLRDDEPALPLADGRNDVDHAQRKVGVFSRALEAQPLHRIERLELVKRHAAAIFLQRQVVNRRDAHQRGAPIALPPGARLAVYDISVAQVESANLHGGYVDVVSVRAQKAVPLRVNVEYAAVVVQVLPRGGVLLRRFVCVLALHSSRRGRFERVLRRDFFRIGLRFRLRFRRLGHDHRIRHFRLVFFDIRHRLRLCRFFWQRCVCLFRPSDAPRLGLGRRLFRLRHFGL